MKNFLVKCVLFFLSPFYKPGHRKNTVLVVSTTGLGDTMWAIPAIRALHKAGKSVSLLTGPYGKELLSHCPYISSLHVTSHAPFSHFFSLLSRIRKIQPETIYVFHASQRPIFPLLSLVKSPELIGFSDRNKGLDSLFTRCAPQNGVHEIQARLSLIGMPDATAHLEVFYPKEKSIEQRIAFFPGAKDAYKQWPKTHFIELGKRLACEKGRVLYIVGSKDERALLEDIANKIPGAIAKWDMPLSQTISFIQSCLLLVTNDSGPMHLGFAAKRPTIALFSPTNPALCGPYGPFEGALLAPRTPCRPCLRRKCQENFCMQQISPDSVYQKALPWIT